MNIKYKSILTTNEVYDPLLIINEDIQKYVYNRMLIKMYVPSTLTMFVIKKLNITHDNFFKYIKIINNINIKNSNFIFQKVKRNNIREII